VLLVREHAACVETIPEPSFGRKFEAAATSTHRRILLAERHGASRGMGSDHFCGVVRATLKPVKPHNTVRIGLAMLKKQKGRYSSVGTPSTADM